VNPSTELAQWLLDQLAARGVRQIVAAPGSRNAPLLLALAARDFEVHVRIDERTAAFLALGMAKGSHRPVAVITTSGTAAANLHPAVLEASHAGVPLITVTADRPAVLRGTGANQTTDQVRLFGTAASFVDLAAPDEDALDAAWFVGGPMHLNVQFTEPLVPGSDPPAPDSPRRFGGISPEKTPETSRTISVGPRTVVVAGDDAGPRARKLAEAAGWPLLAEPTSGARTGENAIRTYRILLGRPIAEEIERVVVFGHPTLSRPVSRLLAREDVEVISVRTRGRWPGRPFAATEYDAVEVDGADDGSWLERWRDADVVESRRVDRLLAESGELTPYDVAAEVSAALPPGGLLYIGASSPIRDLDLMARPYPVGQRRYVIANRGLAGIDGTLSSAIGATIGRPDTTRALLYVGDVTFLHDLTGLVVGQLEQRPDLTIVVVNDNGGSIFATLEQGAPEYADRFEKVFGTPHGVDIATICAGLRIPHWRVESRAELAHALANPNGGIEVIEAVVRRDDRRSLDQAIRA
jgi:2-succinyl-5-enolpyruvyl-6-hydroxy-3-cyclohexene-1-carboxylate synthase